jgi:hypothetical protein
LPSILSLGLPPLVNPYPALNLNFINNQTLDSRITFTRATTATYFNSSGVLTTADSGVARFDYSPSTLQPLGLLIEEARTNLCLQSAAISTSPWAANGFETCVPSTLTDPAGGLNAFKINTTGAGAFERWQQAITVVNGTTYTLSAWVRSTSGTTQFRLRFGGGVTSADLTATTTWQRFTFTLTAGTTSGFFAFNAPSSGAAIEINVWGAQLEAGAFATSYIPTTTTALTRNADVASMTGTNFSSWYNASEGTLYVEGIPYAPTSSFIRVASIETAGAAGNVISIQRNSTDARGFGDGVSTQIVAGMPQNAVFKTTFAGKVNDFALTSNGVTPNADTSTNALPTAAGLGIGSTIVGTSVFTGTIRRIAYYPTRLPNTTLQALTA